MTPAPQPPRPQGEGRERLPERLRTMLSDMAYGITTAHEVEKPLQEVEEAIQQHAALVAEAAVRKERQQFAFELASDASKAEDEIAKSLDPIYKAEQKAISDHCYDLALDWQNRALPAAPPPERTTP